MGDNWVYKSPGEGLNDRITRGTVKYGGGSIMLWGCMAPTGVGKIVLVDGNHECRTKEWRWRSGKNSKFEAHGTQTASSNPLIAIFLATSL